MDKRTGILIGLGLLSVLSGYLGLFSRIGADIQVQSESSESR